MNAVTVETWEAWERLIGCDGLLHRNDQLGEYEANASAWRHRIAGVLLPRSVAEVQGIVRISRERGAVLCPVSCGKNWGYGSRLPAEEQGTVLLDLSRMDGIRNADELSVRNAAAEIEPGVTQGQMARFLRERDLPLLFNVTGAGQATSLLGNSLERGVGYFGLRTQDLSDLEVVLGTGEILRTGMGALSAEAKGRFHYPFGLGPSLDGLFFQSTFGIVTSAGFRLIPRRPCHVTLIIKLKPGTSFAKFVETLGHLRRQGLVECVLHVGSPNRVRVTLSPLVYRSFVEAGREPSAALREEVEAQVEGAFEEAWTAVGPVFGTEAQVAAAREAIEGEMEELASVTWVTSADLESAEGVPRAMLEPLVDLCDGKPTDGALDSPHWSLGHPLPGDPATLDRTESGLRFASPALPLDGELAEWAVTREQEILAGYGFEPYLTLNILDGSSALLITNLVFDKSVDGTAERADEAIRAVFEAWAAAGVYPYRLGLNEAPLFPCDPVHARVIDSLRQVFDPDAVFTGGRYQISQDR